MKLIKLWFYLKIMLITLIITGQVYFSSAQDKMYIHKTDRMVLGMPLQQIDSMYFSTDQLEFFIQSGNELLRYSVTQIDSLTFGTNSQTVSIILDGDGATIRNPLAFEGVSATLSNNVILIESVVDSIVFAISGSANDAGIEIHSDKTCDVLLKGTEIRNGNGPAIALYGKEWINVVLADGTINLLQDGDANTSIIQKAVVFSENDLSISGNGTMIINANGDQEKGIKGGRDIRLANGNLTINVNGNTILETKDNGFDPSYSTAIKSDGNIIVDEASINISLTGVGSKGISANNNIQITGGFISIISSSNGLQYINDEGEQDALYSTCINADEDLILEYGIINTESSGSGGRGIDADGMIIIGTSQGGPDLSVITRGEPIHVSGEGNDAEFAEAKTIKSDASVTIYNGTITITSEDDAIKAEELIEILGGSIHVENAMEGLEAPHIFIHDGTHFIRSYDDGINSSNGYDVDFDDGSTINILGGNVTIDAVMGDGIDSNGTYLQEDGNVIVHGPTEQPEVGIDINGEFALQGGFLIVSGTDSPMTNAPSTGSSQNSLMVMSNEVIEAGSLFHIVDMTDSEIITFDPERSYHSIIFSSDALRTGGNYLIYTGGSYSGGIRNNGVLSQGNYTGGLLRDSFTVNSVVTRVDF